MLNPLSNMVIYWFVFGVVFGATALKGDPSGLDNYALYLLSGLLPWGFFPREKYFAHKTGVANERAKTEVGDK